MKGDPQMKTLEELLDLVDSNEETYDTEEPYQMISSQGDAQTGIYTKVKGKRRTWFYRDADHIYCTPLPQEGYQGMAGATLTFHLPNDLTEDVKAPWATNSSGLYKDTGIDIRDQHLTKGVISVERDKSILKTLLHKDLNWSKGPHNRIETLAQYYANLLNRTLFYFCKFYGGSSLGPIKPEQDH